jgi:hypothetical protein
MDAIKNLLKELDNKVPSSLSKRLNGLENLYARLELAKKELAEKPDDDDLKDALSEITDYLNDYKEDLIEDLEGLIESKRITEAKRIAKEKEAKRTTEEKEAQELEKQKKDSENTEKEKKSYGFTALVIGGILLIGSIGAINIFKNK